MVRDEGPLKMDFLDIALQLTDRPRLRELLLARALVDTEQTYEECGPPSVARTAAASVRHPPSTSSPPSTSARAVAGLVVHVEGRGRGSKSQIYVKRPQIGVYGPDQSRYDGLCSLGLLSSGMLAWRMNAGFDTQRIQTTTAVHTRYDLGTLLTGG